MTIYKNSLKAYEEGQIAFNSDVLLSDNPYSFPSSSYFDWQDGWYYERGSQNK